MSILRLFVSTDEPLPGNLLKSFLSVMPLKACNSVALPSGLLEMYADFFYHNREEHQKRLDIITALAGPVFMLD